MTLALLVQAALKREEVKEEIQEVTVQGVQYCKNLYRSDFK